jgi:type I restriction enzyme M protein
MRCRAGLSTAPADSLRSNVKSNVLLPKSPLPRLLRLHHARGFMAQLEDLDAIEKRLWSAADNLRANSNYASNEYFLPVMGLIFLRHAYSRYLAVRDSVVASLPKRGGQTRALTKADFSQRSAIFLRAESQFDYLVSLSDSDDRAKAIIHAMETIEGDYATLRGVLPRQEYQELDNAVIGQLLRTLNPEELKSATGDVFGRIYEYFLTQFADQGAHDNGEFFTPISLVSLIAQVLEPTRGVVLDPACGSGGMFVQSAHVVERLHERPAERLTFYGLEKNPTTIRLAKMNLAVHGLEGDIQKAITYYEDPHELLGKADFVMANPPFNVDEVDADKVKRDPRLPFGLPGVNKADKVSNGNYLWISYFYSYLGPRGRAGFVMSSQASSAGRDEAKVRQKLIETGAVDAMIAIRSNFFYTRPVPCELWFLDRAKPTTRRNQVLMLDARAIYRKVTRKVYDFSPEQQQNLLSIVWLHRGERDRFLELVASHLERSVSEAEACAAPLAAYAAALDALHAILAPFVPDGKAAARPRAAMDSEGKSAISADSSPDQDIAAEWLAARKTFSADVAAFHSSVATERKAWSKVKPTAPALVAATTRLEPLGDTSRDLVKQADHLFKLASRLADACEALAKEDENWSGREVNKARKTADEARHKAVEQLKLVRYFQKNAAWLTERFPDAELRDVEGLVKLVDRKEIEANDWSLTPGRYVGVAPEPIDEDFDFEEALREIHVELSDLNAEAVKLAKKIARNFEELGA